MHTPRFFPGIAAALAIALPALPAAAQDLRYDVPSADATLAQLRTQGCGTPLGIATCPLAPADFQLFGRAVAGDRKAQFELAARLEDKPGFPPDKSFPGSEGGHSAAGWYARAAAQGDPEAALRYNDLRTAGARFTADDGRIVAQLRGPAQSGDGTALQALSEMYLHGRGVAADVGESMRLLRRAADNGHSLARTRLARRLIGGAPGLPAEPAAGLDLLRRAADSDAEAMDALARVLLHGPKDLRDTVEGYRWLMRAARCGHPGAISQAASTFYFGLDRDGVVLVPPDDVQAYMWLIIGESIARGAVAPVMKAELERRMNAAQVAEAKRSAAAWRVMTPSAALKERFDLPMVDIEADRRAALGILLFSRHLFDLPPGTTPQPWQRIPDFDRLEDIVAAVSRIRAHCQSLRRAYCVGQCTVPPDTLEKTSATPRSRVQRRALWIVCADSVDMPQ